MAVTLPHTATQYVANAVTISRGTVDDITKVGVYYNTDPTTVPEVSDFTQVTLVKPGDPLADGDNTDILTLLGPRDGDLTLTPGDYQVWLLVTTSTEDVILKMDTVTIL